MRSRLMREVMGFISLTAGLFTTLVVLRFCFSSYCCPTSQGINGLLARRHVDYLFIGTSRSRQGYDIRAIEQETGKSAYLLAYNGMQPHLIELMCAYLLERPKPSIGMIVLEFYPYAAMGEASLADSRMYINASPTLKWRLLLSYARNGMRWQDLYALLATEGNETLLTAGITRPLLERMSYHGGYINKVVPGMVAAKFRNLSEPPALQHDSGHLSLLATRAYVRLFRLARQHGVPIMMVEPTMPARIAQGRVYRAGRAQLLALVRANHIPYYTADPVLFDPRDNSLFTDGVHFSTRGRAVFSRLIVPLLHANANRVAPDYAQSSPRTTEMKPSLVLITPPGQ